MDAEKVDDESVGPDSTVGERSGDELLREFGRQIVRLRERRRWSQAELARRLGVTRARLGHWERGLYTPPLKALLALRRELGVSVYELASGGEPAPAGFSPGQKEEARLHLAGLKRLMKLEKRP